MTQTMKDKALLLLDRFDSRNYVPSQNLAYAEAQTYALLAIAEAIEKLDKPEPEPVDDDELVPCPECGEVPVLSDIAGKYFSYDCGCLIMPFIRGRTESIARRRWNAAARIK